MHRKKALTTIGERIRYLRETRNVTQLELAKKTGISRGNLSSYETGRFSPSSEALVSIANFFDVSTDWLLTGSIKKPKHPNKVYQHITTLLDHLSEKNLIILSEFVEYLVKKETTSETPHKPEHSMAAEEKEHYSPPGYIYLPVLDQENLKSLRAASKIIEGFVVISRNKVTGSCFLLKIREDTIAAENDLALVIQDQNVENGELVLVNLNSSFTIRSYYRDTTQIKLISPNSCHPEILLTGKEQVQIIGKVARIFRSNEVNIIEEL
ncbi:MAG: helix-turn-helix domain-containing protein [Bacillota bacterium]|uniref:helix-turn-helix domain-containing protein n=1 Tax=Thermanaerosceptrum fracticalcis TaxID=1712410 RepID=UPI00068C85CB|nr:XRE family transcriptional regulator [Thermanaerosceptrum fracticalcis]